MSARSLSVAAALLWSGIGVQAVAQAADPAAAAPQAPAAASAAAPAELADAEVRRVDREAGKITLRHGEIRHLDMPPMTMVFQVADPALLEGIQPGDKVRFRAVHEDGQYRVVVLQRGA